MRCQWKLNNVDKTSWVLTCLYYKPGDDVCAELLYDYGEVIAKLRIHGELPNKTNITVIDNIEGTEETVPANSDDIKLVFQAADVMLRCVAYKHKKNENIA